MTDVFDLLETQFGFLGVDSDLLRAQALEHSSCVGEEVRVGFAVYEYIVDVYFPGGPCSAYCVESKGQLLSVPEQPVSIGIDPQPREMR